MRMLKRMTIMLVGALGSYPASSSHVSSSLQEWQRLSHKFWRSKIIWSIWTDDHLVNVGMQHAAISEDSDNPLLAFSVAFCLLCIHTCTHAHMQHTCSTHAHIQAHTCVPAYADIHTPAHNHWNASFRGCHCSQTYHIKWWPTQLVVPWYAQVSLRCHSIDIHMLTDELPLLPYSINFIKLAICKSNAQ